MNNSPSNKVASGYFRVPLEVANLLAVEFRDFEHVAAYMAMWRHAFGPGPIRDRSAAGAKAIRLGLGCTDYQSKRYLRDLKSLRLGEKGDTGIVVPAPLWNAEHGTAVPERKKNADVYMLPSNPRILPQWTGRHAYLPTILFAPCLLGATPLSRIHSADVDGSIRRDALLVLLHLYAEVDYEQGLGVPGDRFAFCDLNGSGTAEVDSMPFELGYLGQRGPWHYWLFERNEDNWRLPGNLTWTALETNEVNALDRFWLGLDLLERQRLVSRVITVQDGREAYPLWLSSQEHRNGLLDHYGLATDLARCFARAGRHQQIDAAWDLIEARLENPDAPETNLFLCATKQKIRPVVQTLYTPRFHATTPVNLGGLVDLARRTTKRSRELDSVQRLAVVA